MTSGRPQRRVIPGIALGEVAALAGCDVDPALAGIVITGVTLDSRAARPGDLFAALPGHVRHGAMYAAAAMASGAAAVLTDAAGVELIDSASVPVLVVTDPRAALGGIAQHVHGHPAQRMRMLGVTGTNGKTTVSYLLEAALRAAGQLTGLIGTVGIRIGDEEVPAARTTPEATDLAELLGSMVDARVDSVAMEVSSHAMSEHRIDGVRFDVLGFTNLSQDHLDYHGTMEAYFAAKSRAFAPGRAEFAVIGIDDPWGARLAQECQIAHWTWTATGAAADWSISAEADSCVVRGPGETHRLRLRLPGEFNRANAVLAFAMLRRIGIEPDAIIEAFAEVVVPGRMERIEGGGILGIVDYAHTPDAVERALIAARTATTGRLIAVIGAGGDRDPGKRPLMGAAAAALADAVIVTDDNPRSEDPARIREAVLAGARLTGSSAQLEEVGDRRTAIERAVMIATAGDVVAVLGKGHESGQDVGGVIADFDDRAVLREVMGR